MYSSLFSSFIVIPKNFPMLNLSTVSSTVSDSIKLGGDPVVVDPTGSIHILT